MYMYDSNKILLGLYLETKGSRVDHITFSFFFSFCSYLHVVLTPRVINVSHDCKTGADCSGPVNGGAPSPADYIGEGEGLCNN